MGGHVVDLPRLHGHMCGHRRRCLSRQEGAGMEEHFDLIVGNAPRIRNVPGRKTDVKDAGWVADLVRHGLVAKTFVPPEPQRDLRELLRYRRKLMESRAAGRTRLLNLLKTANTRAIRLAAFARARHALVKPAIHSLDQTVRFT